ncbi:two-component sensor histidine kinase [Pullulanibacillus camelliae]|uniref:histidine kinase n=1 Tax=Pullulanibacillus camelliae TaxID=1707096 RepID=A0A8J2VQ63_9BACL|nr:HAMP domain-containing sensor histidine kinase [Pullulanibacillus camelliae]GGE33490.1 two-component sensor histidine kinase [Pullulanibacillus camelliae]
MKQFWHILKHILGVAAMICAMLIGWALAYFIMRWFYSVVAWRPSIFLQQMIHSVLGFFIFGFGLYIVGKIFRFRNRQLEFFNPMIDAFEQMAQGNFNIDLSFYQKEFRSENHPYYHIIQSMTHMADELGEMEQMRQEFIANVSHEIQSPLTSISGFAQALKNEDLTLAERRHYLDIIETESKRLSKLSENLLKLTSLESEKTPFEPGTYRLDQQIRRVILACEPQWTAKQLDMDVAMESVVITADRELLSQVWFNLIHNSIKFTPSEGRIRISLESSDDKVMVTIGDSGIGMTKEEQVHIFERFYKADRSRNRTAGGSGLGLSIVKKIIDLHHGEIYVESELNKGTQFTIKLLKQASDTGNQAN